MEDLVHDLPFPVDFEQCEQVGKPIPGPVVKFQPHRGNRVDDVDASNPVLESRRWTVLVIPVKELLDRASEQVGTNIAEDCRVLVEGGLHVGTSARFSAIDIVLDRLGNHIILAQVGRCAAHESTSFSGCGLKGSIRALGAAGMQPNYPFKTTIRFSTADLSGSDIRLGCLATPDKIAQCSNHWQMNLLSACK